MPVPKQVQFDRLTAESFGLNALGFGWSDQMVDGVALVTRWLSSGPWVPCSDPITTSWAACYAPITTTWTECP